MVIGQFGSGFEIRVDPSESETDPKFCSASEQEPVSEQLIEKTDKTRLGSPAFDVWDFVSVGRLVRMPAAGEGGKEKGSE